MALLEIRNLHKSYPDGWALSDVNLTVAEGEILCLLGPSGCGKTTLLRLVAGLETPDQGQILLHGQDVAPLPLHRRGVGFMFQEYALFPHKDVFGNVAFGLRMAGWKRQAVRQRVAEVLDLVGLAGFERRDVHRLSGGERQRVALARSLAPQPRLLLLDEPLGALDRSLRERLLVELPAILRRVGVAVITVTHDQEEAFAIADRVVLMRDGRIVQQGAPQDLYRRPASPWVARFLGMTNLLPARVVGAGRVETELGAFAVSGAGNHWEEGSAVWLLIRPQAARPGAEGPNRMSGVVAGCSFRGSVYQIRLFCAGDTELILEWPSAAPPPSPGEAVALVLDPGELALLIE